MPNHKSALKRMRQTEKRTARNKHVRSTMRTMVKNVRQAAARKDAEQARQELRQAQSYIHKAASKGVIHKNTADRKVARLWHLVNSLEG